MFAEGSVGLRVRMFQAANYSLDIFSLARRASVSTVPGLTACVSGSKMFSQTSGMVRPVHHRHQQL